MSRPVSPPGPCRTHVPPVEGCLPVETLRLDDPRALVSEVGRTADQLGALMATVHGEGLLCPPICDRGQAIEGGLARRPSPDAGPRQTAAMTPRGRHTT